MSARLLRSEAIAENASFSATRDPLSEKPGHCYVASAL